MTFKAQYDEEEPYWRVKDKLHSLARTELQHTKKLSMSYLGLLIMIVFLFFGRIIEKVLGFDD